MPSTTINPSDDGWSGDQSSDNQTWTNIRNAAGAIKRSQGDGTSEAIAIRNGNTSGWNMMRRAQVRAADTTVPSTAKILTAKWRTYGVSKNTGIPSQALTLVNGSVAGSALANADYGNNKTLDTVIGDSVTLASLGIGSYSEFNFDAAGIAHLQSQLGSGFFEFGFRFESERANSEPGSYSANRISSYEWNFGNAASNKSQLVITYTWEASVAPVVATFTVPAVTATYSEANPQTASVSPVVATLTVPAVTATFAAVVTASVAAVVALLTVVAVTATSVSVLSASVSPVVATLSVPAVTATYYGAYSASVAPVVGALTVPTVTATYIQVETASASPVTATLSVPTTTATHEEVYVASVSPVSVSGFIVPVVTATYQELDIASVSPVVATLAVPTTTATYQEHDVASVSPLTANFSVPAVSATFRETARVSPVVAHLGVVVTTATYEEVYEASVSPVTMLITIPTVTVPPNKIPGSPSFSVESIAPSLVEAESNAPSFKV